MKVLKARLFLFSVAYLAMRYATAQTADQYAYAKPDSAKAYWTLQAAQSDQTPTVQFYTAHHVLLYQETLPAKARHIDRQTKRALDKLLTNLVNNRVLTSTYLNEEPRNEALYLPANRLATPQSLHQMVFRKGVAMMSVEPTLSPSGQLLVKCAQFANRWLMVSLEDQERHAFFEQRFKTNQYKRSLNLVELPSGVYYLRVGRFSNPVVYRLLVDQSTQQYDLQNEESIK